MGTRLGTWECGSELNWERPYVQYGGEWGTSLETRRVNVWDITFKLGFCTPLTHLQTYT